MCHLRIESGRIIQAQSKEAVMKKVKYSEEQIIGVLKEAEAGMPIVELCRKYGISDATYYNWKAKYGGMTVSDAKKLKQLEDENRRLKQIVADLSLDNQALKAVISKNF
jgi:putative transposase